MTDLITGIECSLSIANFSSTATPTSGAPGGAKKAATRRSSRESKTNSPRGVNDAVFSDPFEEDEFDALITERQSSFRVDSTSLSQPINNNNAEKRQSASNGTISNTAPLPLSRSVTLNHPLIKTNQCKTLPLSRSVSLTHPVLQTNQRHTHSNQSLMKNQRDAPSNRKLSRLAAQQHCGVAGKTEETKVKPKVLSVSTRTKEVAKAAEKRLVDEIGEEVSKYREQQVGIECSLSNNSLIAGIKTTNMIARSKSDGSVGAAGVAKRGVASIGDNYSPATLSKKNLGAGSIDTPISSTSLSKNGAGVVCSIPENSSASSSKNLGVASIGSKNRSVSLDNNGSASASVDIANENSVAVSGSPKNKSLCKKNIKCSIDPPATDLSEATKEEPNVTELNVKDTAAIHLSKSRDSASVNVETAVATISSKGARAKHILQQPRAQASKQAATSAVSLGVHEAIKNAGETEQIDGFASLVSERQNSRRIEMSKAKPAKLKSHGIVVKDIPTKPVERALEVELQTGIEWPLSPNDAFDKHDDVFHPAESVPSLENFDDNKAVVTKNPFNSMKTRSDTLLKKSGRKKVQTNSLPDKAHAKTPSESLHPDPTVPRDLPNSTTTDESFATAASTVIECSLRDLGNENTALPNSIKMECKTSDTGSNAIPTESLADKAVAAKWTLQSFDNENTAPSNSASSERVDRADTAPTNDPSKSTSANKSSEHQESMGIEWSLLKFENDATSPATSNRSPRNIAAKKLSMPNPTGIDRSLSFNKPFQAPKESKASLPSFNHGATALSEEIFTSMQDHHQDAVGVVDTVRSESSSKSNTFEKSEMTASQKPSDETLAIGIECTFVSLKEDNTSAAESSSSSEKKSPNVNEQKHNPLDRKMSFASVKRKEVVDETVGKKPKKSILKKPSANEENEEPASLASEDSLGQVSESQSKQRRPFGSLDGNALTRAVSSSFSFKKKNTAPKATSDDNTAVESIQETTLPEPLRYFAPLAKLAKNIIRSSDNKPPSDEADEKTKNEQQVKELKKRTMLQCYVVRQWLNVTRSSKNKRSKGPTDKPSKSKSVRFHRSAQELDGTFSSYSFYVSPTKPRERASRKSKKYYYDDDIADEGLLGDIRDTLSYNMNVLKSVFSCFANNFNIEEEINDLQCNLEDEMVEYSGKLREGTSELLHKMYDMNLLSEETVLGVRDDLRHQHANLEEHFTEFEDGLWNGIDKLYEKSAAGKDKITKSVVETKNLVMESQWFDELNEDMHNMFQQLITDIQQLSKLIVGDGYDGSNWYESLGNELRKLMNESAKWFDDQVSENNDVDGKMLTKAASDQEKFGAKTKTEEIGVEISL